MVGWPSLDLGMYYRRLDKLTANFWTGISRGRNVFSFESQFLMGDLASEPRRVFTRTRALPSDPVKAFFARQNFRFDFGFDFAKVFDAKFSCFGLIDWFGCVFDTEFRVTHAGKMFSAENSCRNVVLVAWADVV